jgi:hypothetical protein
LHVDTVASFERGSKSSRTREFHPQPLTDPDVNVSAHPALIVQPLVLHLFSSEGTSRLLGLISFLANLLSAVDGLLTFDTSSSPTLRVADLDAGIFR